MGKVGLVTLTLNVILHRFLYISLIVVSKENLERFIEGHSKDLEDMQSPHQHSAIMSEVYYILADDCLKSMDNQ